jgi:hypothetical protein
MEKTTPSLYVVIAVFAVIVFYLTSKLSIVQVKEKKDVSAETAVQKMMDPNN